MNGGRIVQAKRSRNLNRLLDEPGSATAAYKNISCKLTVREGPVGCKSRESPHLVPLPMAAIVARQIYPDR